MGLLYDEANALKTELAALTESHAELVAVLERLLNAAESQVELMRIRDWRRNRDCPHSIAAPGRFCDKCSDWLEAAYDDARALVPEAKA